MVQRTSPSHTALHAKTTISSRTVADCQSQKDVRCPDTPECTTGRTSNNKQEILCTVQFVSFVKLVGVEMFNPPNQKQNLSVFDLSLV